MKLKKILKHIDTMINIIIYSCEDGEDEELFHGSVMDVPYKLLDAKLDTDINGEAISLCSIKNEKGSIETFISIFVKY